MEQHEALRCDTYWPQKIDPNLRAVPFLELGGELARTVPYHVVAGPLVISMYSVRLKSLSQTA